MRSGSLSHRLTLIVASLRVSWLITSRSDRAGLSFCLALLVVGVAALALGEAQRGSCLAPRAAIENAMARSDERLREASNTDQAGRCAVYRDRVTLLTTAQQSICNGSGRSGSAQFATFDAELRFYTQLITAKCNRTYDPSCSGPACAAGQDGG